MYFCLTRDKHVGVPDASCSQVTTFLVNCKGRPYMVALKDNKLLLYTSAVERIWQKYDGQDQNMALSFRLNSLEPSSSNLSPSVGR